MRVVISMDNGLYASLIVDEILFDSARDPVNVAMLSIRKAVEECVNRRNEKRPEE